MKYAILCYHDERVVTSWSREEDDAVLARLAEVTGPLERAGRLGPVIRLLPTTAATTVRSDREEPLVLDGPFAETKEQLLGLYVIDAASLDEVVELTRRLGEANPGGAYEIRPLMMFRPSPPEAAGDLAERRAAVREETSAGRSDGRG